MTFRMAANRMPGAVWFPSRRRSGIEIVDKIHNGLMGNVAVTMLQLSNIAWIVNYELALDAIDGNVKDNPAAMQL